jgi:type I restriction enzyme S subunit
MSEFVTRTLREIASINIGGTPPRDTPTYWAQSDQDGHPWVSIADLGSRLIFNTKERITDLGANNSNVKRVPEGSLIMSFKLTIGKAGIAGNSLYTNEAIAAIIPNSSEMNASYLYYVLPPVARNAITDNAVKGVTLNKDKLGKLRIRFPISLPQQRRIAEILSTVDEAIEATEALIAKQQQIKAGLMHDLFTRGVWTADSIAAAQAAGSPAAASANVGQLRPPQSTAPELYKDSPLGWIPKDWEVGSFNSVFSLPSGQVDPTTTQYRDYILVAPDHIEKRSGRLLGKHSAASQGAISGKYLFSAGDIVYSKIRPYLRKAILADFDGLCSADMYPLRLRASGNSAFYFALILGEHFSKFAESVSMRSGFPKINRSELSEYNCPYPSIFEQDVIGGLVTQVRESEDSLHCELAKLNKTKQGLMQDLLSGRVSVSC